METANGGDGTNAKDLKKDCFMWVHEFEGKKIKADKSVDWTRTPKKQKESECKTIITEKLNVTPGEYAAGASLTYATLPAPCK